MKCFKCLKDVPPGIGICPHCGQKLTVKSIPQDKKTDRADAAQAESEHVAPVQKEYRIGDTIKERYEVSAILGDRGIGYTYKVKDKETGKICALKLIRPSLLATDGAKERLLNALKRAATLNVREIAALYDYGEDEGIVYFVAEYMEGLTLRKLLDERKETKQPFMGEELTSILTPLCRALIAVYNRDLVHGNLKPDNIFMLPGGLKITVPGITASLPPREFTAVQKDLENASLYIAPEVVMGGAMTKASDIYSLGVIVYEMLTGVIPSGTISPPVAHNEGLPGPVNDAVIKAVGQYRTQRQQTVYEFYKAVVEGFGQKAEDLEEAVEQPEQQTAVDKAKQIQAEVIKEILTEKGGKQPETRKAIKLPALLRNTPQVAVVATMFVILAAFIAWLWFKPINYKPWPKGVPLPPTALPFTAQVSAPPYP